MVVRNSEIFRRKCRNSFGGPRTKTKFVKWAASRKRLRTTALGYTILLFPLLIHVLLSCSLFLPPVLSYLQYFCFTFSSPDKNCDMDCVNLAGSAYRASFGIIRDGVLSPSTFNLVAW